MIKKEIVNLLKQECKLFHSAIHGVRHWQTVEKIGHYLAGFTGADNLVISYFAYFHDCMRINEYEDRKHGLRGSQFAVTHRSIIPLTNTQFDMLTHACKGHTYGARPECVTINTCWDADRLDIGRVGIQPSSEFLKSTEAKRIAETKDFLVYR